MTESDNVAALDRREKRALNQFACDLARGSASSRIVSVPTLINYMEMNETREIERWE